MAEKAALDETNEIVFAGDAFAYFKAGKTFHCASPNCKARMHLVNTGTDRAYFATYPHEKHKYPYCTDTSLVFYPDKVDEKKFDWDALCRHVCYGTDQNVHRPSSTTTTVSGSIGTESKIAIRTAKMAYSMCLQRGINGYYNGVPVRKMLLCKKNQIEYDEHLKRFSLVEASFYHKINDMPVLIFDFYTAPGHEIQLKCTFQDSEKCWKIYNLIKTLGKAMRAATVVIAGEWELLTDDPDASYGCVIRKTSQIFLAP